MTNRILFRVDANQQIGYGHLVRCISLANALSNHQIIFASTEPIELFIEKQCTSTFEFKLLKNESNLFEILSEVDLVIIDGYQFDESYHEAIANHDLKLICIDDLAEQKMFADLIINPTPSIIPTIYKAPIYTQFCIGLDYALIRSAFLKLATSHSLKKIKDSLFICFGGSDPLNITLRTLEIAFSSHEFNEIHVVLGPGYSHLETLKENVIQNSIIHVHQNLNEIEMANLMRQMEYAILPSSGILLEGLAAKMKIISGFYIANQRFVYQHHLEQNTFIDGNNFSKENIFEAIIKVKSFSPKSFPIDGKSIDRVKKVIGQLLLERTCKIRKANSDDILTTFEWANNIETRKFAFNRAPIPFENHTNWFNVKTKSFNCSYYILEFNAQAVGSIRFDIADKIALISYLIDPSFYGKGFGTIIMKLGLKAIVEDYTDQEITEIQGYVFPENIASIKTFERFGFTKNIDKNSLLFTKKYSNNV